MYEDERQFPNHSRGLSGGAIGLGQVAMQQAQCNNIAAAQEREIPRELNVLRCEAASLEKLVDELRERLAPIAIPQPSNKANGTGSDAPVACRVSGEISDVSARIGSIRQSLRDLLGSLAI